MKVQRLRLSENALRVLRHRYLAKDAVGAVVETPAELFERVARAVASAERNYGADDEAVERLAGRFYRAMAEGVFLPNSPTLMNAGRELGMLSACFVLPVEDSVEGIFESVKIAALIQKAGGGTGFAFDRLRPTGDHISTSGGTTSGPISFWRVFSEATSAIQQGAFENFNISVKVADEFLRTVQHDPARPHVVTNPRTQRRYLLPRGLKLESYTLADLWPAEEPAPGPCYTVGDVWDLIVGCAHATGEPGLCFIDRINETNSTPHLGRIEATNPCGEQPLLDYEACNLGSINLARFVGDDGFDERSFRRAVRLGVRFLDDVIDVNNYLVEPIRRICLGNRKIGLGVMGLADALMKLEISYDSDEAIAFADGVARALTEEAFAASEALARQRGCFPNHPGSRWDTVHHRPMRNAAVTTVAPTGTISILAGCTGGIEPAFALAFWRNVMEGQRLLEVNGVFREALQRRGLWSESLPQRLAAGQRLEQIADVPEDLRRVFLTAREVPPARHVQMQATFQKYIDGAISKTINLPAEASCRQVGEVFLQAYHSGCKGITVYRDGCRPLQPMSLAQPPAGPVSCPRCQAPLDARTACSRCPRCGYTICS